MCSRSLSSRTRFRIPSRIETSSIEIGSSASTTLGSTARARAIAHAAAGRPRARAGTSRDRGCGNEPDRLEQREHARTTSSPGTTRGCAGAGDVVPHLLDRVQRRERVLEDHLHLRSVPAHAADADARDVLVLEQDRAARRLVQPAQEAGHRALAAPALADERRDLPAAEREAHVVHRAKRLASPRSSSRR